MKKLMTVSKSAKVRGRAKRFSGYRHIALVIVDADVLEAEGRSEPAMISERARGLEKILDSRYGVHVGSTARSEGRRQLEEWRKMAEHVNSQKGLVDRLWENDPELLTTIAKSRA